MPELPEVETIKRGLEKKIIGLKIRNIEILNPKTFQGDPAAIQDVTVTKVWRRAKVLGIDLSNKLTLLFHLKMSGQIIFIGNSDLDIGNSKPFRFSGGHPTKDMLAGMPNKSTRVIFEFEDGSHLYFNDQRKFGWIKILDSDQLAALTFLKNLGPEPLESGFTPEVLERNLSRRKKMATKVAILDQQIVSGIGNIYACEACFIAKIHPKKLVSQLTKSDYQHLHKGIIDSLESSIKYGGSTKQHFYNDSGEKGFFLEVAYVYDRKGLPCRICNTPIEKITLGGRGTYFCPNCQK